MKLIPVLFAIVVSAAAASTSINYAPPVADNSPSTWEYIPPTSDAGGEIPQSEEHQEQIVVDLPVAEVISAESVPEEKTDLTEDGYRYKTVRRLKYRQRRDVSELPKPQYLPPSEETQGEVVTDSTQTQYLPPSAQIVVDIPVAEDISDESVPEKETDLAEDGYRYKTVRRLKYRQRRDVSELVQPQYLPPSEEPQEKIVVDLPLPEDISDESVPEEETDLAEDGYRYKTVRRLKYRQRRDVSELPQPQYLPPSEEPQGEVVTDSTQTQYLPPSAQIVVDIPVGEDISDESVPEEKTDLTEDGYRYKTVRRLKYRQRHDVSELVQPQYLPPSEEPQEQIVVDLPPPKDISDESVPEEETDLAEDGYRYKTVRRLKYRQRRDVSELPQPQYLPPSKEPQGEVVTDSTQTQYLPPSAQIVVDIPVAEDISDESVPEEKTDLAKDGYRYKTVRRLKYRQRHDVSELPKMQYLPPSEEPQGEVVTDSTQTQYLPPSAQIVVDIPVAEDISDESVPEEETDLAEDGYRYKTVRRLKYRQRRDISELPQPQYLPPSEEPQGQVVTASPQTQYLPPSVQIVVDIPVSEDISVESVPEEKTDLAEDGYRYKTVRRLKYRQRRDVSELPKTQYLPPSEEPQEQIVVDLPVSEDISAESVPEEKTDLAEDGYRYKTVRLLKYRQRRDVSELPKTQYLPPSEEPQEQIVVGIPVAEDISDESVLEKKTDLTKDGYRYKTVRRLKYRQRRDVSELPQPQYLPPSEEPQGEVVTDSTQTQYLPPFAQIVVDLPASEDISAESVPEEKTDLAEDGYRYKTVRRLKYRQRRDVSELPKTQYLPPSEEPQEQIVVDLPVTKDIADESVSEEKTDLAEDGYRYKTVRRLKYRQRRDVSELPQPQYLPPSEEPQGEVVTDSTQTQYLPPSAQIVVDIPVAEDISDESVPEEKTDLAEDGYRYKTVRRLKYRQRRDVSELPQPQYLPPSEEPQGEVVTTASPQMQYLPPSKQIVVDLPVSEDISVESVPEEKTNLAEEGYRYKTVRRLKYRQRRDVSELPKTQYLPPSEEPQEQIVVDLPVSEDISAESVPEEKTDLVENGYRYKTVRRLKYRQRRDVSELLTNKYLPPTKLKPADSKKVSVVESAPKVETKLSDDGYRYKVIRKLKYRH